MTRAAAASSLNAMPRPPLVTAPSLKIGRGVAEETRRAIPEETAVALVFDGGTEAVMMATPADLEDFALGFSLTEGIVADAKEIRGTDVVDVTDGVELRIWLTESCGAELAGRRRVRAGPTGCGLCGVESLAEALRPLPAVRSDLAVSADEIIAVVQELGVRQPLNARTHAVHAAALYVPGEGIVALREDVGRHNALDKLAGALARAQRRASDGAVLMTSRVSVELVQKAAMIGAPILAAVSAPTALALRTAEAAGVTIVGVVRPDGLEVFTRRERIGR